jgi:hypothetical protein
MKYGKRPQAPVIEVYTPTLAQHGEEIRQLGESLRTSLDIVNSHPLNLSFSFGEIESLL